jgi:hypothetical protein
MLVAFLRRHSGDKYCFALKRTSASSAFWSYFVFFLPERLAFLEPNRRCALAIGSAIRQFCPN